MFNVFNQFYSTVLLACFIVYYFFSSSTHPTPVDLPLRHNLGSFFTLAGLRLETNPVFTPGYNLQTAGDVVAGSFHLDKWALSWHTWVGSPNIACGPTARTAGKAGGFFKPTASVSGERRPGNWIWCAFQGPVLQGISLRERGGGGGGKRVWKRRHKDTDWSRLCPVTPVTTHHPHPRAARLQQTKCMRLLLSRPGWRPRRLIDDTLPMSRDNDERDIRLILPAVFRSGGWWQFNVQ